MKYFPIFQEYSTKLTHFTVDNGHRHAKEAQAAAQRLGVPPTIIYFAVDYDATDPEVTSHILPYFQAVTQSLGGGYRVGIYASRNICTRVSQAGYAVASFVSDMSTGFSGNLGFPIPNNWVFDQFHEISGYRGKWDLDRVAYSPKFDGVDQVISTQGMIHYAGTGDVAGKQINPSTQYSQLDMTSLIWHLENRVADLQASGKVGWNLQYVNGEKIWVKENIATVILNLLSAHYLNGGYSSAFEWTVSAQSYRTKDNEALRSDRVAAQILQQLDRYVKLSSSEVTLTDISGQRLDMAHLFVVILGYNNDKIIPREFTGWAGDLATAMKNVRYVEQFNNANPPVKIQRFQVADALVGKKDSTPELWLEFSNLMLKGEATNAAGTKSQQQVRNEFSRMDLCADADAIALHRMLTNVNFSGKHLLSECMQSYFMALPQGSYRFRVIAESVGASNEFEAAKTFASVMYGSYYGGTKEYTAIGVTAKLSDLTPVDFVEPVSAALAKRCFE